MKMIAVAALAACALTFVSGCSKEEAPAAQEQSALQQALKDTQKSAEKAAAEAQKAAEKVAGDAQKAAADAQKK